MNERNSKFATWRRESGLTLDEVAGLSGYSISYLSRVERGLRQMPPNSRVRLSRSLGAQVSDLFDPIAPPIEASAAA